MMFNTVVVFSRLLRITFLVLVTAMTSCKERNPASTLDKEKWPDRFGFGSPASKEKIAYWDIDIRPDGKGLPEGVGKFYEGKIIYKNKCAACHGDNGIGGPYSRLVASDTSKEKTIGNYWPYATTLYDYIRRAMPFNVPGSLSNDEVYHLTAYLLGANRIIDSGFVINARNLPEVKMPAQKLFVNDDRKDGKEIR